MASERIDPVKDDTRQPSEDVAARSHSRRSRRRQTCLSIVTCRRSFGSRNSMLKRHLKQEIGLGVHSVGRPRNFWDPALLKCLN